MKSSSISQARYHFLFASFQLTPYSFPISFTVSAILFLDSSCVAAHVAIFSALFSKLSHFIRVDKNDIFSNTLFAFVTRRIEWMLWQNIKIQCILPSHISYALQINRRKIWQNASRREKSTIFVIVVGSVAYFIYLRAVTPMEEAELCFTRNFQFQ